MTALYKALAQRLTAIAFNESKDSPESRVAASNHRSALSALVKEHMPSGSGFDSGTDIDLDKSNPDRLVFSTAFHHMNEHGLYCGWTEHRVTVRPSLTYAIELTVSGRNRNGIKDYAYDVFRDALLAEVKG
jgi:hypothetical protein